MLVTFYNIWQGFQEPSHPTPVKQDDSKWKWWDDFFDHSKPYDPDEEDLKECLCIYHSHHTSSTRSNRKCLIRSSIWHLALM